MPSTTYRPGSWLGIVRSGVVVVLDAGTDPDLVHALWKQLGGQQPTVHAVLNAVTAGFGADLAAMPPFAVVVSSGNLLHVILRGDMWLVARTGEQEVVVSGQDVSTWSERLLPRPESIVLTMAEPDVELGGIPAEDAAALPLGESVVWLQELAQVGMPAVGQPVSLDEAQPRGPEPMSEASIAPAAGTPGGAGVDEVADAVGNAVNDDDFAGFALASDAEWTAQLADMSALDGLVAVNDDAGNEHAGNEDAGNEDMGAASDEEAPSAPAESVRPLPLKLPPPPSVPPVVGGDYIAADDVAEDATAEAGVEEAGVDVAGAEDAGVEAAVADEARLDEAPVGDILPAEGDPVEVDVIEEVNVTETEATEVEAARDAAVVEPAAPAESAETEETAAAAEAPEMEEPEASVEADEPAETAEAVEAEEPAAPPADAQAEPAEAPPSSGPMVLARLCPQGHANRPDQALCHRCGAEITGEPTEVVRPSLGRLHLSTGEVLELDHSLIIGRLPSVSEVAGGAVPRLVQVHSPGGDISRSHVEVRLDGWDIVLVDLHATNGTVLLRDGQVPRRLGVGEELTVLDGDTAELGDGVFLTFEGLL